MNNEAEAIQQFVVWLLQTLDPADNKPSGDWNQAAEPEQAGSMNLQFSAEPLSSDNEAGILNNASDPVDPGSDPPVGTASPRPGQIVNPQDLSMPLDEEPSKLKFGDIPAVQNRFHALLKNRLKTEIERKPPRFPWETEQQDYQYDPQYEYQYDLQSEQSSYEPDVIPAREPAAATPLWAAHLKTLNLPIALPDSVLQTLFEQCRHLVQSSLREGRCLVRAVESLFPEEGAALNDLAGMVLTSPMRSSTASLLKPTPNPNFPTNYEEASRPQQMVLSLLAARQLLEAMTLTLSPDRPTVNHTWLTDAGVMKLEAHYSSEPSKAQINVQLPTGGTVRFQQGVLESIAACTQAGSLSVSLSPVTVDSAEAGTAVQQPATLTIELAGADAPLAFAVRFLPERSFF